MFQYEYEKRPPSANSCDSRATMTTDWSRSYPSTTRVIPNADRARRPLPPRPIVCERMPTKTTVPLKVWIIASASCFAVCAALVLATVVITKWGTGERYTTRELFAEAPEPIYSNPYPLIIPQVLEETEETTEAKISVEDIENDLQIPILQKLSIFKNVVASRDKKNLVSKPQLHPVHDETVHHIERKIEKKDRAKLPENPMAPKLDGGQKFDKLKDSNEVIESDIPDFKPTLPDMKDLEIQLPANYLDGLKSNEFYDYYNDENLYDDYMQSNTMTSYLIEKVQELHDWITTDPDFEKVANVTRKRNNANEFGQVLKALNESLIEGNVTIIMNKLKDIYFGDNYTNTNHSRKVNLSNSTDLLSFGILTLDVMLLHNIQLMAWENQEAARTKMMRDPDVFAFNALFLDPSKVDSKQNELNHFDGTAAFAKRQNLRQDTIEEFDFGKNLLENILEIGMSTARAAIHLGRAYKNTRLIQNQLSNRDVINANIQNQLSRNIDGNSHALYHLQTSFNKNDSSSVANTTGPFYTELDCVWLLYCRNLVATSKLNAPYGTMARINGMALRMLSGELSADKALDTMMYEVLTGWTELKCNDMFPRCSKVNAASVVMDSIIQPMKKTQPTNRT